MAQAITINLPDDLYQQLQQAAKLSHQPVETIIAQSLAHSLPPLLEDIPLVYQPEVYPLLAMSNAQLKREMRQTFPSDLWSEYEALLEKKKDTSLTPAETARLTSLRRQADVMTFRKGYAAVLLKRRGHRIPTPEELARST